MEGDYGSSLGSLRNPLAPGTALKQMASCCVRVFSEKSHGVDFSAKHGVDVTPPSAARRRKLIGAQDKHASLFHVDLCAPAAERDARLHMRAFDDCA